MLVNGKWSANWQPVQAKDAKGGFVRQASQFRNWITVDGQAGPEKSACCSPRIADGSPAPKGPSVELIHTVVEMKQRNPSWGCPRIAQQIALAFHIQIEKDVVRRILGHHYRPGQNSDGPSWLTFLGHMKDSLWSMDLFQCESATLRSHWVRSSWINIPAGSLASASMRDPSMVSPFVGCSTVPFEGNAGCRSI